MSTRTHVSIEGVVPWPDEVAQAYRRAGYWQGTSLASHIAAARRSVSPTPRPWSTARRG